MREAVPTAVTTPESRRSVGPVGTTTGPREGRESVVPPRASGRRPVVPLMPATPGNRPRVGPTDSPAAADRSFGSPLGVEYEAPEYTFAPPRFPPSPLRERDVR